MASLDRYPKSAKEWTDHDLDAYNITTTSLTPDEFFPAPDQPLDHIDPAIRNLPASIRHPNISVDASHFFICLDSATHREGHDDIHYVVDFVNHLLRLLDFNVLGSGRELFVAPYENLPFTISGDATQVALADVCLLVAFGKQYSMLIIFANGPEAQVVAIAVAAFQYNNTARRQFGLITLDEMTFPCFNMIGRTRPTFYLVRVTAELSRAVILGQYPSTPTRVLRCETAPINERSARVGMEDLEYRRLALKHFLAFKELAQAHWEDMLEGPAGTYGPRLLRSWD